MKPLATSLCIVLLWLNAVQCQQPDFTPFTRGGDALGIVTSPDGKWIAFRSTRPLPEGSRGIPATPPQSDPATDVWLASTKGGPAIPLAGKEKPYGRVFNDAFFHGLAFSPDGRKLAFVADDGRDPRSEVERANGVTLQRSDGGEGYTGYGSPHIWVATLSEKPEAFASTTIVRLTSDDAGYGDPQWTPDGKTIVVHANRTNDRESVRFSINKNYDIWAIDVESRGIRQLSTGPGPEVSPRIHPDGKRLVCLSSPRKGPHADVFNFRIVDLESTGPKETVLFNHHDPEATTPPHRYPSFPLPRRTWSNAETLSYNADAGLTSYICKLNVVTGKGEDVANAPPAMASPASLANDPFLKGKPLGEQRVVTWKSDGFLIEGALTLPHESIAKPPYKLVVHPHGGPHSRARLGFDPTVQAFAVNGYAVLQPNFRGSAGYGVKFLDADRNDFGFGDMRDIMAGVDSLIDKGLADKDRLFVYGVSYGGYMTTWLVGQTDRFRAAVAQNAVTDLTMMWCLSDIQSWTEWEFGGKPWQVPEAMRKHSPLSYVGKVKTPTLILHSRDDRRCPLPMGQAYHQALKGAGVPTDLVIYPDEGHGIRQPKHREDVLTRTLEWFAKYDRK